METILITHIGTVYGIMEPSAEKLRGAEMKTVNTLNDAWIAVENGRIRACGSMDDEALQLFQDWPRFNAQGMDVLPAFADSHTHIVFARPRNEEFVMRIKGQSYEEIAAAGGGILNSAKLLRETSEEVLYTHAYLRAQEMILSGTGAIEIKSGYGLDTASEIKMLRVIRRLGETLPVPVKSTFLGAHAFPPEYRDNHGEYIRIITEEMLPLIAAEGLADYIDVFCDRGFYSPEETLQILEAGARYGLKAKIHGNELGYTGGVQAAIEAGALSVDHLEHCGPEEIEALKHSQTMPVALPGTSFFLGIPYTPGRAIIDAGLPLAIASDHNPGSSPSGNMMFCWALACTQMKLLPEEAFNALTINAAAAMGLQEELGSITPGKRANLIFTQNLPGLSYIPYSFSRNLCKKVMINGSFMHQD